MILQNRAVSYGKKAGWVRMPNYFTGHIDKWLLLSESETDFAVLFVRSWIPFNAWYCNNYGTTKDRSCLDQVKNDGNQFRARIIALLRGYDDLSLIFKAHLAQMHSLLEQHPIPDALSNSRISFQDIYFRENPITSIPPQARRNYEYKTELLTNKSVRAVVVTKRTPSVTIYQYTHTSYDISHFLSNLQSSPLNIEQRTFLSECFVKINPKKKESLILPGKRNALQIGRYFFVNDCNLISQALIEVLYSLRCKLFHGELQPSKDNLRVYEPAYYILRILLNSLR